MLSILTAIYSHPLRTRSDRECVRRGMMVAVIAMDEESPCMMVTVRTLGEDKPYNKGI